MQNVTTQLIICQDARRQRLKYACPVCTDKWGFVKTDPVTGLPSEECVECSSNSGFGDDGGANYTYGLGDYFHACGDCRNRTIAWKTLTTLADTIGCQLPELWSYIGSCHEAEPHMPPEFDIPCAEQAPYNASFKILFDAWEVAARPYQQVWGDEPECASYRLSQICYVCGTDCCEDGVFEGSGEDCGGCMKNAFGLPANEDRWPYITLFTGSLDEEAWDTPLFPYACKLCPKAEDAYADLVKHSLQYECMIESEYYDYWCIDTPYSEVAG